MIDLIFFVVDLVHVDDSQHLWKLFHGTEKDCHSQAYISFNNSTINIRLFSLFGILKRKIMNNQKKRTHEEEKSIQIMRKAEMTMLMKW